MKKIGQLMCQLICTSYGEVVCLAGLLAIGQTSIQLQSRKYNLSSCVFLKHGQLDFPKVEVVCLAGFLAIVQTLRH